MDDRAKQLSVITAGLLVGVGIGLLIKELSKPVDWKTPLTKDEPTAPKERSPRVAP